MFPSKLNPLKVSPIISVAAINLEDHVGLFHYYSNYIYPRGQFLKPLIYQTFT